MIQSIQKIAELEYKIKYEHKIAEIKQQKEK